MDEDELKKQIAEAERRICDCDLEILKCKGDFLGLASQPIAYLLECKLAQLEKVQAENRAHLDALSKQQPLQNVPGD